MIRISNGIISRKHAENRQRIHHLGKIAKNHSEKITEHEKTILEHKEKHAETTQMHKELSSKIAEIEKRIERKEMLESTEQMIANALRKHKKGE